MSNQKIQHHEALIIGAGFSGLYQLYCLRDQLNLDAKIIEAGDGGEELGIGTDIQGLDVTQKATRTVITSMMKY